MAIVIIDKLHINNRIYGHLGLEASKIFALFLLFCA